MGFLMNEAMRKIKISSIAIIAALCGCAHDPFVEPINSNLVTLSASLEPQVKTMVVDGGSKVFWEASEVVKVFTDTDSAKFSSSNVEPAAVADFTGYLDLQEGERIVALYPYESSANLDSDGLSVILPNRQIGRAGTFSRNTNISVAVSHDKTLYFQNACGGIRFTLDRNDITSVDLEGLGGEVLAGEVKLAIDGEVPRVLKNIAGKMKVSLSAPDGGTFVPEIWYYVTLFPVEFSKGVKLTFHTSDGKTGVAQSNKPLTVERSIYAQKEHLDSQVSSWNDGKEDVSGEDLSVCTMEVDLPKDADPGYVSNLVVRNVYGEYPLRFSSGQAVSTKAGDDDMIKYNTDFIYNSSGNMFQFLVDPFRDNVLLSTISKPDMEAEMNARSTALVLLMTNPLLITSSPEQIKATEAALKGLTVFDDYVSQVKQLSSECLKNQSCPDYRVINQSPVIGELIGNCFKNSDVPQDALYISNVHTNGGIVGFHLMNNYKRVLHVYGRRVKMYDNNLIVKDEEEICLSLSDILKSLLDEGYIPDNYLIKKEVNQYKELVDALKELKPYLDDEGFFAGELDFPFPYICNSGSAKYWKIVGAAYDNLVENGRYLRGNESSIYESNHDIEFDIDDYDKLYVDVYGIGRGMHLAEDGTVSDKEMTRMKFVLLHGAYYDVIKPFVDLVLGIQNAEKFYEHKYDFRYGARNAPMMAFLGKLAKNMKGKDLTDIINKLGDGDMEGILDAMESTGKYVLKQVFENTDKDSYLNLLYNIYKKQFGITATSEAFRNSLKSVWKSVGVATNTIKISELVMNAGGGAWGAMFSQYKNTFIIDESDFPYIDAISPHGRDALKGDVILFRWAMHKSNSIGYRTYDLDIEIVDENLQKHTYRYPDLIGTEFELPSKTFPDLAKVVSAKYRITAKSAMVGNTVCQTEWIDMLEDYKNVPDVPGYNL